MLEAQPSMHFETAEKDSSTNDCGSQEQCAVDGLDDASGLNTVGTDGTREDRGLSACVRLLSHRARGFGPQRPCRRQGTPKPSPAADFPASGPSGWITLQIGRASCRERV